MEKIFYTYIHTWKKYFIHTYIHGKNILYIYTYMEKYCKLI